MAVPSAPEPSAPTPATANSRILPATPAGIARAAELLTQGQLVILPTETVYGIALNLTFPRARQAARQIKTRADASAPTPWVVHVASVDDLLSWVPRISAVGRRLITKSVPGPVAFQVKLDAVDEPAARARLGDAADETVQQGYITLRCPECPPTQTVLQRVATPVAIIGTGTASHPAAYELADLPPDLLADGAGSPTHAVVQAALDAGPTRHRRSSTLVRIDGEKYSVVRQGVIDERIIHRMADFTILFVCTGNTCRSPMAAALATSLLAAKFKIAPSELSTRHIVVQSAGLHAARGMPATSEAVEAVKEFGADLSHHISQSATEDLLRRADVIYTMTDAHKHEVLDLFPWAQRKTFRIDPDGDIADPIGASLAAYQRVARRLAKVLENRLSELPV